MATSFFGSVCEVCKHDTSETMSARTIKLGTHTSYDKRVTHTVFQGQGSKVKIMMLNIAKCGKHDRGQTV